MAHTYTMKFYLMMTENQDTHTLIHIHTHPKNSPTVEILKTARAVALSTIVIYMDDI